MVLPNWIGDAVMATPALHALRSHFHQSRITLVGRDMALETLSGLTLADATLAIPPRGGRLFGGLGTLINGLRAGRHDLGVLLPNSFRSAMAARLAGIGRLAGYDRDGRGWLLTDKLLAPCDAEGNFEPISAIDYYGNLVGLLGASCESRRMKLVVPQSDADQAEELLQSVEADPARPLVMINPGAAFGVSKMWDPHRYAAVADTLVERHRAQIIINAAPGERKIAAQVEADMSHDPLINFARRRNSLSMLKALLDRSALLITNDTGARHVAAALDTPVVTLFGSTDPRWSRIDYERERTIRVDMPCSPCHEKTCPLPAGPQYHGCMAAITPEMVLPAAEELLDLTVGESEAA